MAIISIKKLSLNFGQEKVLQNVNLEIAKGQKVAVTGQSGTGKTSFFNVLLGFIPHFKGEIHIAEMPLNKSNINAIRSKTAYVPQHFDFDFKTVEACIYFPFHFYQNKRQWPEKSQVLNFLKRFNLNENILQKPFNEISGGQKQRIMIITALLQKKEILLLDEPFSALDSASKLKLIEYLFENNKQLTLLTISHDKDWIQQSDFSIQL